MSKQVNKQANKQHIVQRKRAFSILLTAAMVLLLAFTVSASAQSTDVIMKQGDSGVMYLDANGNTQFSPVLTDVLSTGGITELGIAGTNTWYLVNGTFENSDSIVIHGNVNLILENGSVMTAQAPFTAQGIIVGSSSTLTIFAQSRDAEKMGMLIASSSLTYGSILNDGIIIINGGIVEAIGSVNTPIIGSGDITVNGGELKAISNGDNAIYINGNITINSGMIIAGADTTFVSISGNNINVNGGTVTAFRGAVGISGNNINVNGGTVMAIGSDVGIRSNNININGGTVTANGGNTAFSSAPNITLNPYTATWSTNSDGSGSSTGTSYIWSDTHRWVMIEFKDPCADGHLWGAWLVTIPASCTVAGEEIAECTRDGCAETNKRPLAALGHLWDTVWTSDKTDHWNKCLRDGCTEISNKAMHTPGAAATCATAQTCTVCSHVIAGELGHSWGAWVDNSPTSGQRTRMCTQCSESETEVLLVKTVAVGKQIGTLTAGTAGTVTFPITTANIANGNYGVSITNLPTGVTVQGQVAINNGMGILTLAADANTAAGVTDKLTLTIDGVTSTAFTLTVNSPAPTGGGGRGTGSAVIVSPEDNRDANNNVAPPTGGDTIPPTGNDTAPPVENDIGYGGSDQTNETSSSWLLYAFLILAAIVVVSLSLYLYKQRKT